MLMPRLPRATYTDCTRDSRSVYLSQTSKRDGVKMQRCSRNLNNVPCCCESNWRVWQHRGTKKTKDDSRSLSLSLQWSDESAVAKKRNRHTWMFIKVLGTGVRIKFLYSELWGLFVFFWRSSLCWCCPFCVLPGPPSRILWLWPHLWTTPQFNLPNVITGQANQPPGRLLGPAKHYQLWHT